MRYPSFLSEKWLFLFWLLQEHYLRIYDKRTLTEFVWIQHVSEEVDDSFLKSESDKPNLKSYIRKFPHFVYNALKTPIND